MVLIKTKERNIKQCTNTITRDNSVAVIRLYTPNPVRNLTHQPDALYNLPQFRNETARERSNVNKINSLLHTKINLRFDISQSFKINQHQNIL